MYGSAYVTAQYLKEFHPEVTKVRVVGMNSICEELKRVGLETVGGEDEIIEADSNYDFMKNIPVDHSVNAVVVGLDTKFNYNKMAMANLCIQAGKAKFFATNDDPFDMVGGRKSPGAGAMVSSIHLSLNDDVTPTVIGKPSPYAFQLICREHGIQGSSAVMIGDRLDTDILFGNRAGIKTCLVMTGCTESLAQVE